MELIRNRVNRGVSDEQLADARRTVLARLIELNRDVEQEAASLYFSVQRTNDRKGYRDPRPFNNSSPYQGSPRVRVVIELELEDDQFGRGLVDTIAALEAESDSQRGAGQ